MGKRWDAAVKSSNGNIVMIPLEAIQNPWGDREKTSALVRIEPEMPAIPIGSKIVVSQANPTTASVLANFLIIPYKLKVKANPIARYGIMPTA